MRHAGPVRAELGIPTVFNFIGPLSNPARIDRQVIGVNDPAMAPTVIGVLQQRGAPRAMVVHGHDGMDELTITGRSTVWEIRDGDVQQYDLDPRDLGIEVIDLDRIAGGDAAANATIAGRVFAGEAGPHRDIVTLNAAAGLLVSGVVDDLASGLELARQSVDSGGASAALDRLVAVSNA
jgi:anthranilate phosphoribosyltransferase